MSDDINLGLLPLVDERNGDLDSKGWGRGDLTPGMEPDKDRPFGLVH